MAHACKWLVMGLRLCWLLSCYYIASSTAQNVQNDGNVKVLAIFNQDEMETMARVLNKTLAALNKESHSLSWQRVESTLRNQLDPDYVSDESSLKLTGKGVVNQSKINAIRRWKERLKMESVIYSGQWWMNQTAEDLCRLILLHKPVAILALAEEQIVFHASLAASLFHIPIIGTRVQRGLDDSSFQVSPAPVCSMSLSIANTLQSSARLQNFDPATEFRLESAAHFNQLTCSSANNYLPQ